MTTRFFHFLVDLFLLTIPWFKEINPYLIGFVLFILLVIPLLAIICLLCLPEHSVSYLNKFATGFSAIQLILCLPLLLLFYQEPYFGTIHLTLAKFSLGFLSFQYALGIDGISLWFVVLNAFMTHLCIIYTWNFDLIERKRFFLLIFITSFSLLNFFLAADIVLLYIAFESVLIPLFLMIGLYGSRFRRIHAAYQFVFYTLIGSFFMLLAIIYIFNRTGTTLLPELNYFNFSLTEEKSLWLAIAIALAVKIPLPPLHIWLPEAHVEAPTVGSVLLAAVVLKMGGYGVIRVLMPLFPLASVYYQAIVFMICALGMTYASLTALRQNDIKKIIAYSSVVHMAYATAGLFSFNVLTICPSIYAMICHGIISGGLFFSMGCLYDRYQTRDLRYYGSLYHFSKLLSFSFFFFLLANIAFPGTANFPAELGIFVGLFTENMIVAFLFSPALVLNGAYNIWLITRLLFGPYLPETSIYKEAFDLTLREKIVLGSLWYSTLILGIFPGFFLSYLEFPVRTLTYGMFQ